MQTRGTKTDAFLLYKPIQRVKSVFQFAIIS